MAALVGRDGDLARLRGLVDALAGGRGGSAWLEGEPGIGKTTLLTAALAGAPEQGCQVARARADQTSTALPLRLVLDLLKISPHSNDPDRTEIARLLVGPSGPPVAPGQMVTATLTERLVDLVQQWCARNPVLLAADDLQWADELSLAVWGRLQHLTHQLPLLLIAASRPVPQREQLAPLRDNSTFALDLAPLDATAVTTLTATITGAPPGPHLAQLTSQAGGNPLYLEELLAALIREQRLLHTTGHAELTTPGAAVPTSLTQAIHHRLGFLSEPALATLRLAALIGPEITAAQLALVAGQPATTLLPIIDEALTAGVMIEAGPALAFRHELIRHALREATPTPLRQALHHQAAQAFAHAGAPAEDVATQLLAAEPTTAEPWLVEWALAAAPALVRRTPRLAAALLARLRATLTDQGQRDQLAAHHASALLMLGEYGQVEQLARPVLDRSQDPTVVGPLTWTLGYALVLAQQQGTGLRSLLDRVADSALLTPLWEARAQALRTLSLSFEWEVEEAEAWSVRAEAYGTAVGDPVTIGYALNTRSIISQARRHDHAAALALIDKGLTVLAEELDATDIRLLMLYNRLGILEGLGDPTATDQAARELAAHTERGSPTRQAGTRLGIVENAFHRGRWDDAAAELQAMDLPSNPTVQIRLRGVAALLALYRDDQAALAGQLHVDDEPELTGYLEHHGQRLLIARSLAASTPAGSVAGLRKVFLPERRDRSPRPADCYPWLADLVRLALDAEDRPLAEAAGQACQDLAVLEPLPRTLAATSHCRGLLAADPSAVAAAAEDYRRLQLPLFEARAREDAAVLAAGSGDPATARSGFVQATALYTQLGAGWCQRRADARLRRYGVRRGTRGARRRPTTGWAALTPTELTVAQLVAEGLSNPGIASRLYLSRRTVETHISHILTKLAASSRVDIVRHATEQATRTEAR